MDHGPECEAGGGIIAGHFEKVGADGIELGPVLFKGLERDGAAPKAIAGALRTLDAKPLDCERFVVALKSTLDSQGWKVSGALSQKPAGLFKWRGQQTNPSPVAAPPVGVPDSKEIEPDTSEKSR